MIKKYIYVFILKNAVCYICLHFLFMLKNNLRDKNNLSLLALIQFKAFNEKKIIYIYKRLDAVLYMAKCLLFA